jgi:cytochrome c553
MRGAAPLLLVAAAAALQVPAAAQDAAAGRRKATACQQCHGLDGLSKLPEAPNLAAHPQMYLERSLRAYRGGERRNEVMSVVAKTLSDDDIRDLAAYYAAIVVEVKDVPGGRP